MSEDDRYFRGRGRQKVGEGRGHNREKEKTSSRNTPKCEKVVFGMTSLCLYRCGLASA
jgi:hypothetical protein